MVCVSNVCVSSVCVLCVCVQCVYVRHRSATEQSATCATCKLAQVFSHRNVVFSCVLCLSFLAFRANEQSVFHAFEQSVMHARMSVCMPQSCPYMCESTRERTGHLQPLPRRTFNQPTNQHTHTHTSIFMREPTHTYKTHKHT